MVLYMTRLSAIEEELRRCQQELNLLGMGMQTNNRLIISTGDISDVDGFFALAQYAKTGADVLFIMNYPAYINTLSAPANETCTYGLGYTYTAADFFKTLDARRYGTPRTMALKRFSDLGFAMANGVWAAADNAQKGNLYFCIGGVNQINPFSRDKCKNELNIFSKFQPATDLTIAETEGAYYDSAEQRDPMGALGSFVASYDSVYMDFNGSVAFFDSRWQDILIECAGKLKGVFIQGGVLSTHAPTTIPAIPGVLNRLSCATMNQFYCPAKTASFLEVIGASEAPIYIAPNNATHTLSGVGAWGQFMRANSLENPYLEQLAAEYYKDAATQKIFDYYTAFALTSVMNSVQISPIRSRLFYDALYGISIIGDSEWKTVKDSFKSKIPVDKTSSFEDEFKILDRVTCNSISVNVLKFQLSNTKLIYFEPTAVIALRGELIPVVYKSGQRPSQAELDNINNMKAFNDWKIQFRGNNFSAKRYSINKLIIHDIDMFGPTKLGFLKFQLDMRDNQKNVNPPSIVFMRGASVAILVKIRRKEDDQLFTILTIQPRVPVGLESYAEIPAGMMDSDHNFAGVAAKELKEETQLLIPEHKLIDLTNEISGRPNGIYLSPGACDETMRFFLFEADLPAAKISEMQGKQTGCLAENEVIKLQIIPLVELANNYADAKSLIAYHLYSLYIKKKHGGALNTSAY